MMVLIADQCVNVVTGAIKFGGFDGRAAKIKYEAKLKTKAFVLYEQLNM